MADFKTAAIGITGFFGTISEFGTPIISLSIGILTVVYLVLGIKQRTKQIKKDENR